MNRDLLYENEYVKDFEDRGVELLIFYALSILNLDLEHVDIEDNYKDVVFSSSSLRYC